MALAVELSLKEVNGGQGADRRSGRGTGAGRGYSDDDGGGGKAGTS